MKEKIMFQTVFTQEQDEECITMNVSPQKGSMEPCTFLLTRDGITAAARKTQGLVTFAMGIQSHSFIIDAHVLSIIFGYFPDLMNHGIYKFQESNSSSKLQSLIETLRRGQIQHFVLYSLLGWPASYMPPGCRDRPMFSAFSLLLFSSTCFSI